MSLDNIQLPAILLQDLYKNALIDLKTDHADPGVEVKFSYLGDNQQRVAIIVKNITAIYLPEEELNFLLGILTACKLSMADIALVNTDKNKSLNYITLTAQLNADKILLFGVEPSELQLPLQFPFYQVQKFNNQVYLSAPTLGQLEADRTEKTKLWNCLKQVFAIG